MWRKLQNSKLLSCLDAMKKEGVVKITPVHAVQFRQLLPNNTPCSKFSGPPSSTTTSPPSTQHSLHPTLTQEESWLLSLSSMKRPASKPLVPAQKTILTGRASLWKTTTKPPFMRFWTLHISGEVLHFPDAYCLFAILLGQPVRLGDAMPLSCSPLSHHCMLDQSGGVVDNYVRLTNRATCTVQNHQK